MRKDLTAISALSALIAFTAGVVLCLQVSHLTAPTAARASGYVIWVAEVAIFGTALFAWRPKASFLGWLLGIAALVTMRIAVASGAGLVVAIMQQTTNMGPALRQTSTFVPRACAVGFALMACYPLRVWVPLRNLEPRRQRSRDGRSPRAAGLVEDGDRGLLIVTVNDRAAASPDAPRSEVRPHSPVGIRSSIPLIEGEIELPLSTVLALLPENLVTDRALVLSDTDTMTMPFEVILPQLKEAQIVFSVAELRAWIPLAVRKALLQPVDSDIEIENGLVSLPLELVIPQLPPEAFELPHPSPPAWAKVDAEEHVVFATV
jgi:flagellar biosynthesis protein FliQ